jgi:hypothetical protein
MQINISIVLAPPYPASCIRHWVHVSEASRGASQVARQARLRGPVVDELCPPFRASALVQVGAIEGCEGEPLQVPGLGRVQGEVPPPCVHLRGGLDRLGQPWVQGPHARPRVRGGRTGRVATQVLRGGGHPAPGRDTEVVWCWIHRQACSSPASWRDNSQQLIVLVLVYTLYSLDTETYMYIIQNRLGRIHFDSFNRQGSLIIFM